MTKIEAMKQVLSTPQRPVTTKELTDLKKADPRSFEELGTLALAQLGQPAE